MKGVHALLTNSLISLDASDGGPDIEQHGEPNSVAAVTE